MKNKEQTDTLPEVTPREEKKTVAEMDAKANVGKTPSAMKLFSRGLP